VQGEGWGSGPSFAEEAVVEGQPVGGRLRGIVQFVQGHS